MQREAPHRAALSPQDFALLRRPLHVGTTIEQGETMADRRALAERKNKADAGGHQAKHHAGPHTEGSHNSENRQHDQVVAQRHFQTGFEDPRHEQAKTEKEDQPGQNRLGHQTDQARREEHHPQNNERTKPCGPA